MKSAPITVVACCYRLPWLRGMRSRDKSSGRLTPTMVEHLHKIFAILLGVHKPNQHFMSHLILFL